MMHGPTNIKYSNKTGNIRGASVPTLLQWKHKNAFSMFSTLSCKLQDFRKRKTESKICMLIFSTITRHIPIAVYTEKYLLMMSSKPVRNM